LELRVKVVLLESALERVPRELWKHPQVVKTARRYGVKPGDMLLDKSLHYNAMAALSQKWKRGRPDIVHITLLNILDSPLASQGILEIYMHVYDGRVFRVLAETRIPKSYERFRGLMAQLLKEEKVPPEGRPLIYKAYDNLSEFVADHGRLLLLREGGTPVTPGYVFTRSLYSGLPLGIGAFPRGDFRRSTLRKAKEQYSIYRGVSLKAWTVASRILCAGERIMGWEATSSSSQSF
jgi:rRNA small subunit pseudouridine methyltransferase Nep1